MHHYTEMDTRRCFRYLAFWEKQNHFVFIGDIRLREIYQEFVNYLKPPDSNNVEEKKPPTDNGTSEDDKTDLEYLDYKLRLRVNFIYASQLSTVLEKFSSWEKDPDPPMAVIASCTYKEFFQGNLTHAILDTFRDDLGKLVKPIDDLVARKSKVLWKLLDPIDEDYFEYELPKLDESKIANRRQLDKWRNIKNRDLDRLNRVTVEVLEYSDGDIWSSGKLIAAGLIDEVVTGYKISPRALKHNLQILLNMYCNDNMNYNDGTCCSSSEPYTILQIVTYAILGVW